ncbi:MAG: carboxypeptidase regulatory-like domain-containing protein [Planctomycetes bacterium]|nr:carboxypeptidase regulatory-like domain-containing protein [Planctomycetota bacterium]
MGGPLARREAAGTAEGAFENDPGDPEGLEPDAAPATLLYGWVRDDRGRPILAAEVSVSGDGVGEGTTVSTDENGHYAIPIDGGAAHETTGSGGPAEERAIRFVQAYELGADGLRPAGDGAEGSMPLQAIIWNGVSPDDETEESQGESPYVDWGAPPRPLHLQLSFSGGITFLRRAQSLAEPSSGMVSDGAGSEGSIADRKPTVSVTVTASAPGFLRAREEGLVLERGDEHELDFRLRPGLSITGRTLDRTGTPLGGVEVKIAAMALAPDADPSPPEVLATTSDGQGGFAFDALPQGEFILCASIAGYLPCEAAASAGGDAVLSLTPVATLGVRVWHRTRSLPIRGARVKIVGPGGLHSCTMTDYTGGGSFGELGGGTYRVSVHRHDFPLASEEVVLAAGEAKTIEFAVADGFAVEGRFRPSSEIAGGLEAYATRVGGARRISVSFAIDESGAFRFDGLPAGKYSVVVTGHRKGGPEGDGEILAEGEMELPRAPGAGPIELVEKTPEEPDRLPPAASVAPGRQPDVSAPVERATGPRECSSLESFFPDDGRLRILDSVSVASLLALLQRHSPGTIVWSLKPKAEERARRRRVDASGDLAQALEKALEASGIFWEIRNGVVFVHATR